MAARLQLHQLLETFTEHVYFQPPTNVKLQYPCIIYKRDFAHTKFADDKPYDHIPRYMVREREGMYRAETTLCLQFDLYLTKW